MSALDIWAFCALGLASAALYFRSLMLDGDNQRWVTAPFAVRWALRVAGIISGSGAYSLLTGGHASAREAVVYTAWGLSSLVMLVNLWKQRPDANVVREILDHLDGLVTAPREAIGRAVDRVREAARRGGFHA